MNLILKMNSLKNVLKEFKRKVILLDENQIKSFVNNSFKNFISNIYELNKLISKSERGEDIYDLSIKERIILKNIISMRA